MQASPRVISLAPSWLLAAVFWLMASVASLLALFYLPGWGGLVITSILGLLTWRSVGIHARGGWKCAVTALRCGRDGVEYQSAGAGLWRRATVCDGATVYPWLTVLTLRDDGQSFLHRHVVIVPERVGAGDYRWMCSYLKWGLDLEKANAGFELG